MVWSRWAATPHAPRDLRAVAGAQRPEIRRGKTRLEEVLGHGLESFSYPFGWRLDYTDGTVAAVRAAGFSRACSNIWGLAGVEADPFQLPRAVVPDGDGDAFARLLDEWTGKTSAPRGGTTRR